MSKKFIPLAKKVIDLEIQALQKLKKNIGKNGSDTKTKALSKMMSSNEIVTLINALGTGSKDFNIENLRYDTVSYTHLRAHET